MTHCFFNLRRARVNLEPNPNVVEVNAQNFQSVVAETSQQMPVLLEFYAEGAEQCAPTSALLQKLVALAAV